MPSNVAIGRLIGITHPLAGWLELETKSTGPLQSQPAVVRDSSGAIHVFAVLGDNQVGHGAWRIPSHLPQDPAPPKRFGWEYFPSHDGGVRGVGHGLKCGTDRLGVVVNDDDSFEVFAFGIAEGTLFHAGPTDQSWQVAAGDAQSLSNAYDIAVSGDLDGKGTRYVCLAFDGDESFIQGSKGNWGDWKERGAPSLFPLQWDLAVAQDGSGLAQVVRVGLDQDPPFHKALFQGRLSNIGFMQLGRGIVGALSTVVDQLVLTSDRRLAAFAHDDGGDLNMLAQVKNGVWAGSDWVSLGGSKNGLRKFTAAINTAGYLEVFAWGPDISQNGSPTVLWHRVQYGLSKPPLWQQFFLVFWDWFFPPPPTSLLDNDPGHPWGNWIIDDSKSMGSGPNHCLPVVVAPHWPGQLDLFAIDTSGALFWNTTSA